MYTEYPIAMVEWVDSGAGHGWTSELTGVCLITSVGFLINEPDPIILCEAINHTKGMSKYGCNTAIPRSQVKSITYLSESVEQNKAPEERVRMGIGANDGASLP